MNRQLAVSSVLWVALTAFITAAPLEAVTVEWCQQPGGVTCLCITWENDEGAYIDIRCKDEDYFTKNNTIALPGAFMGTGQKIGANAPHPGTPLSGATGAKVEQALGLVPSTLLSNAKCAALFNGSNLSLHPALIATEYVEYRSGEGMTALGADGRTYKPCDRSVEAFTKCCNHHPYVYICDSFQNLSPRVAARKLIHELLHVAGQPEDGDSAVGPGEPPTPSQLDDAVRKACGL